MNYHSFYKFFLLLSYIIIAQGCSGYYGAHSDAVNYSSIFKDRIEYEEEAKNNANNAENNTASDNSTYNRRSATQQNYSRFDIVALSTANIKSRLTEYIGGLYFGLYNGSINNCEHVSVIYAWRDDNPNVDRLKTTEPELVIWNYIICSGFITEKVQTQFPGKGGLPRGFELYITRVSRDAQRYGTSQASSGGYIVRGTSLRSEDKCLVDVSVFKGLQLLTNEQLNGCE